MTMRLPTTHRQKAAEDVANITVTGSLDYLIANAVYMPSWSALAGMGDLYVNIHIHTYMYVVMR